MNQGIIMSLNEREKYCLALIITKGGEASYDELRNTIFEFKECFRDLSEDYLKYQAIKNTLRSIVKKGYLFEEKSEIFRINPVMELGFIKQYPVTISKALHSNLGYREEHILEFDTNEIERELLNEENYVHPPWALLENLKEALRLQKMGSFDAVLVACGRCVEAMMDELDVQYSLFEKRPSTGQMIKQLRNERILTKMKSEKVDMENFGTFIDGINVVYRFRNVMGAHEGWAWGSNEQVAQSCLILTFYLADLYVWILRKVG